MRLNSTNDKSRSVTLREAVLSGLAPDGGLYMPAQLPLMPGSFIDALPALDFREIAYEVSNALFKDEIATGDLRSIIEKQLDFPAPLRSLSKDLSILELFHGPTFAFKDFGARFMAGLMGYFNRGENRPLLILVATSGDTGSAVAAGFLGTPGIEVVILYPSGKVSEMQEKQLTTAGQNITALEIEGCFDDCQKMVKQAFVDPQLTGRLRLSSANSINIARLIPQSFYYFSGWGQLCKKIGPAAACNATFSVPSGNFGNLTAGLLARRLGLPIKSFIAATNINSTVPEYLESGEYRPRPSMTTISNAMDVGAPSNFARMLTLYDSLHARVRADIAGYSFSDQETRQAMSRVFAEYRYVLDPHTAVGYLGVEADRSRTGGRAQAVVLATAHPAKFKEVVEEACSSSIELPENLRACLEKEKRAQLMPASFEDLKAFLLENFGA